MLCLPCCSARFRNAMARFARQIYNSLALRPNLRTRQPTSCSRGACETHRWLPYGVHPSIASMWGTVHCAVGGRPQSRVRVAAGVWSSSCTSCRLLHLCSARTLRRARSRSAAVQQAARQRSRHASLTLRGQAAPLSCSLPELRVPRGETAGAAFLLEGVTVQARLPELPGTHASGRLPFSRCPLTRCPSGPLSSAFLPHQAGDRDLLVDVDWAAMPGHRVGLVGANGTRAQPWSSRFAPRPPQCCDLLLTPTSLPQAAASPRCFGACVASATSTTAAWLSAQAWRCGGRAALPCDCAGGPQERASRGVRTIARARLKRTLCRWAT